MPTMPTLTLRPQGEMPILGFGTWELRGDDATRAVQIALEDDYRHLDTAWGYGNHEAVGQGIRASGVPREDIFLTTKVPREKLQYDGVVSTCEESLKQIGVEYVDLY